ncbi:MAG: ImmA/IrrE family metallo-endopeptidase [Bacteroidales bacterium]|nr:ImmA/IrrE family metallo-endopeptidase [Bacteroidales bacterium]
MKEIKPLRLSWPKIREIAEDFRRKYVEPTELIPLPIHEIIEFKLGLDIIPIFGLKEQIDTEGFLQSNLTAISVDSKTYVDDRYKFRLNFTFAHEVGHLVLHSDQYKLMQIMSVKDYIQFQQNFDEESLEWFEKQANEFAGRLLVPVNKLKEFISFEETYCTQLTEKLESSSEELNKREIESYVLDRLSSRIYKKFEVSKDVVKKRIRTENLRLEFDFLDFTS